MTRLGSSTVLVIVSSSTGVRLEHRTQVTAHSIAAGDQLKYPGRAMTVCLKESTRGTR